MATPTALILDKTSTGKGALISSGDQPGIAPRSFQVGLVGAGAVSATVKIYGCNDGRFMQLLMTFTIAGTLLAMDAADDSFPWSFYQAEVVALGAGTSVTVTMGG